MFLVCVKECPLAAMEGDLVAWCMLSSLGDEALQSAATTFVTQAEFNALENPFGTNALQWKFNRRKHQ